MCVYIHIHICLVDLAEHLGDHHMHTVCVCVCVCVHIHRYLVDLAEELGDNERKLLGVRLAIVVYAVSQCVIYCKSLSQ